MRRLIPALSIALLLVLAGCSGLTDGDADTETPAPNTTIPDDTEATATEAPTTDGTTAAPTRDETTAPPDDTGDEGAFADPAEDRLGWEQGYWYNESLPIDQSDGLNQSELDVVTARMMARVEQIRQLEFTDDVSVEVISREEYESRRGGGGFGYGEWQQTYYEAAFLVDQDTDVNDAFQSLYGSSVAGYYSPQQEAIVLVSDNPDEVRVDPTTLAHELVHALQVDALPRTPRAQTLDQSTAYQGVTEGDPNFVMDLYVERCETEWDCIEDNSGNSSVPPNFNFGLYASIWVPYSDGPTLVESVYEDGGWDAVNDLYSNPPASTEQVIHPETYPDDDPVDVSIEDRSSGNWERADRRYGSVEGTFGEATLFSMLWHNGVIASDHVRTDDNRWNYSHPYTDGWGGDAVVPYTNGEDTGYVFKSTWDTEGDAQEFREGYVKLLESKGATEIREGVYRVPDDSGFGGVYRISVEGKTMTVVKAPDEASLDEIHDET